MIFFRENVFFQRWRGLNEVNFIQDFSCLNEEVDACFFYQLDGVVLLSFLQALLVRSVAKKVCLELAPILIYRPNLDMANFLSPLFFVFIIFKLVYSFFFFNH